MSKKYIEVLKDGNLSLLYDTEEIYHDALLEMLTKASIFAEVFDKTQVMSLLNFELIASSRLNFFGLDDIELEAKKNYVFKRVIEAVDIAKGSLFPNECKAQLKSFNDEVDKIYNSLMKEDIDFIVMLRKSKIKQIIFDDNFFEVYARYLEESPSEKDIAPYEKGVAYIVLAHNSNMGAGVYGMIGIGRSPYELWTNQISSWTCEPEKCDVTGYHPQFVSACEERGLPLIPKIDFNYFINLAKNMGVKLNFVYRGDMICA